jgi:uncharacterized membrane protein HdeD (DUF308 family)
MTDLTGRNDGRGRPGLGPLPDGSLDTPPEPLQRNWGWLLALGAALILGGIVALVMPFLASVAIEIAIGAVMLAAGGLQVVQVFRCEGWRARSWAGLSALLYLAGGVLLLLNPLAGLVALTLVIAAIFLVDGFTRLVMGVRMRPERGWGWITAGGALSAALGVAIMLLFPGISLTLLGILVGVSFILEGWSFAFLALAARRAARGEG